MIPAKLLGLLSAVQVVGAAAAQAEGFNHFITGGLSVGSLVTAIGAIFVMKEKVRRLEVDRTADKSDSASALRSVADSFKESLKQIHADHREDAAETRAAITTLTTQIGDVKALVEARAAARRGGDR